jgi:transposase
MLTMRGAPPLLVTDAERARLREIASSPSLPHRAVRQAEGLLAAADGVPNEHIGVRVGVSANTVRAWRAAFERRGVDGVGTVAKGRGRKAYLPEGTVAEVIRVTCNELPEDTSTHWTTRTLAKKLGVGKDTVARIWRDHELKPWKVDGFKVSNDPRFEEKLLDVVGLYLDPPAKAVVFSFDEKTQCQALDRTQPSLPMRRGRANTMTHDYKRNGTTDLFAALNIATGDMITQCRASHTASDVLAFFKKIDRSVPRSLDIHVVLDNLSAHKAPEVTEWLAHPRRARWHLHFTPTSSSWLNLVERWFKQLTDRRLRRGTFSSVPALIDAISTWVDHWNDDPKPFVWHAAAEEILEKVRRGRKTLSQVKSATQH